MRRRIKNLNFLFAFALTTLVFATISIVAESSFVTVEGRSYLGPDSCRQYFSTMHSDLRYTYTNDNLPAGTRVVLHRGFRESRSNFGWQNPSIKKMSATSQHTWQETETNLVTATRGSTVYSHVELVFEILLPDGKSYFDNGGAGSYGHYGATLTLVSTGCEPPAHYTDLPVSTYTSSGTPF